LKPGRSMSKGYCHFTREERVKIYTLKKVGIKQKDIANEIGKSESSISKELKRNKGKRGYRDKQANEKAVERRVKASQLSGKKMTERLKKLINSYIIQDWSPVQISGYLKKEYNIKISHESIYQHVLLNKKCGGLLYKHLRRKGKKYNKRLGKNSRRGIIPNRKDISERPKIVDQKIRIGDFEIDTIIGAKHKRAIISFVDRASKYSVLIKVRNKTASAVTKALCNNVSKFKEKILTITADNGKEFAYHEKISKNLGADVYFATPYHSWERGLNEHTNGLVRQYFPKKTNFDKITEEEVLAVQKKLNSRPRKVLNFYTPEEVFSNPFLVGKKISLHT